MSSQTTILTTFLIGAAHLNQLEPEQAIIKFSEAIVIAQEEQDLIVDQFEKRQFRKDLAQLYIFRGIAEDIGGDTEAAVKDFQTAAELDQTTIAPYIAMGNMYYSRSDWGRAEEYYSIAVNLNRFSADAHYSLGNVYFSQDNLDEAILSYSAAIDYNALFDLAYYNLGLTQEAKGNCLEAVDVYQKTVEVTANVLLKTQALDRIDLCGKPTPIPTIQITGTPLPTIQPGSPLSQVLHTLRQIPILNYILVVATWGLAIWFGYTFTGGPSGTILVMDPRAIGSLAEFKLRTYRRQNKLKGQIPALTQISC